MKWTRLFGLTAGRGRRPSDSAEDDPAGMGTAFGLDASVQEPDDWRADDKPASASAQGAASPAAVPVTWNDRIVRRSRL